MVQLNDQLLLHTTIAGLMVIAGVIVKNSGNKLNLNNHKVVKPLGMGLFVGGWLYCAYIMSSGRVDRLNSVLACTMVVASVVTMKTCMDKGRRPGQIFPIIFILGWVLLGYASGEHLNGNMRYLGLLASALVIGSMMVALPYERKQCLVDGPGMPMFVVAWGIIIFLNSNR